MKLTQPEIKFIDNYLIKNKVKFWDVRLELLDHIVSAVEDKTETEGISFNEALLEVHPSFGNQLIKGSIKVDEVWTNGLYQSNIGFEKFTRNKQKQLGKKIRKELRNEIVLSFKKPNIYIELLLIASFSYLVALWSFAHLAFGLIVAYFVVYLLVILRAVYHKVDKRSMQLNSVYGLGFAILTIPNAFLQILVMIDEPNNSTVYLITSLMLFIFYPLVRANIALYQKCYERFKKEYKFYFAK
jgi:hypothetical protein